MELDLPVCRLTGALVEAGDPGQVIDEVGPQWRIHLHARRERGVHLLLYEGRVEMAGIDDDQANIRDGNEATVQLLRPAVAPARASWRSRVGKALILGRSRAPGAVTM